MDGGNREMKNKARHYGYIILVIEILALLGILGSVFFR